MLVTCFADISDWQGSPCVERGLTFCTPLSLQLSCWLHLSNWHLRPCNLCGKDLHSCLPTTCSFVPLAFNKVLTQGTQKVLYTVLYKVLRPCNQCENGLHSCLPTLAAEKTQTRKAEQMQPVWKGVYSALPTTCISVPVALHLVFPALYVKYSLWDYYYLLACEANCMAARPSVCHHAYRVPCPRQIWMTNGQRLNGSSACRGAAMCKYAQCQ